MFADSVRQFKPGDFPKLAEFVKKQFHEKYILSDEKFFVWQYRANPYLDDYAFFLLEQDEKLYGYIGLVPLDYKIEDRTARLNVYANLFVDERVRGLGLGTLLIKKAMAQGSPAMISGYTPESFSIYQKLGDWRAPGNFYRYVYIFNQERVKALLPDNVSLPPRNAGEAIPSLAQYGSESPRSVSESASLPRVDFDIQFKPIKTFDSSFDNFWQSIRNRYAITVERTSAYLNWRYANHPRLDYEIRVTKKGGQILGLIIYRIERLGNFAIARIVDFISDEQAEADILRAFVAEVSARVDMIDFIFSGQYCHETLKRLGFFDVYGTGFEHLPMYFNPISYSKNYINFCVWQEGEYIDKNTFYNHNSWYLTRGDGDQDRPNPH